MERKQQQIDHFIYYFEEQILKFKFLSKKTRLNPSVQNVHELRSVTRRLRVVLWMLEKQSLAMPLKKLQNALGKVRAQDVLLHRAKELDFATNKVEKKRRHRLQQLHPLLKKEERNKMLHPLYKLAHSLQEHPFLKLENRFFILKCRAISWVHRTLNNDELHLFRISLKKFRYASEAFGKNTRILEQLVDMLGDAHDLEELRKNFQNFPKYSKHQAEILRKEKKLKKQAQALARKSFSISLC